MSNKNNLLFEKKIGNTLDYRTSCLLAWIFGSILVVYWLFISTYRAHGNALFCKANSALVYPMPKLNNYFTINRQQIKSLLLLFIDNIFVTHVNYVYSINKLGLPSQEARILLSLNQKNKQ